MLSKNSFTWSRARVSRRSLMRAASSVTNRPAVRWLKTRPSRSISIMARCMVLGFTPASAARSRTEGSRSPGSRAPLTIFCWIWAISWV